MTEATKPDISPEKERGALLRSLAVNLKNLMYKSVARLLSMQPAFYALTLASRTVTSTHSCSIATILSCTRNIDSTLVALQCNGHGCVVTAVQLAVISHRKI